MPTHTYIYIYVNIRTKVSIDIKQYPLKYHYKYHPPYVHRNIINIIAILQTSTR